MRKDQPTAEDIRESLKRLGQMPELARSQQLLDFLTYVVEQSLCGAENRLKAYSIATEVFGRNTDFDPQTDSIVRVQARRLRSVLGSIYSANHEGVKVRIYLPVGSYVPRFDWIENAQWDPADSKRFESYKALGEHMPVRGGNRRIWLAATGIAALALVMAGILVTIFWPNGPQFQGLPPLAGRPIAVVSEFEPSNSPAEADAGIFQTLLVQHLSSFDGVDVRVDSEDIAETLGQTAAFEMAHGMVYRVTGQVELRGGDIAVHVIVTRLQTSQVIWSHEFSQPDIGITHDDTLRAIARMVATNVVAFRGNVQADARAQLPDWAFSGPDVLAYACGALYRDAIGLSRAWESKAARDCAEARYAADESRILAKLNVAVLDALDVQRRSVPSDDVQQLLQPQIEIGADAVRALPASAFAHELYGRILWAADDIEGARREFEAALKANSANSDAEASLGIMEVLAGNSSALFYVENAIRRDMWPAGWYFTVRALDSLRHEDYSNAIHYALTILPDDAELGLCVLVATASGDNRPDLIESYTPALLGLPQFAREGVMARLSMRIKDPDILAMLRSGLSAAGISDLYLDHGYDSVQWPP